MTSGLLGFVLLAAAASAQTGEVSSGATERYRGRSVREVRLVMDGAEVPEASRDLVELEPGEPYRPESVRRSIKQLFALGSFSDIKVEAEPVGEAVDVLFRLYPRVRVEAVRVSVPEQSRGLTGLRARMVRESEIEPGAPLDVEALGEAAGRIRALLRREGFLWASVEPEASFRSPTAVVVFHVEAGPQARLRSLRFEGAPAHVAAHVRREVGLAEGDVYSRRGLDGSIEEITSQWKSLGFYQARVGVEERLLDEGEVELVLTPETGPRIDIDVQGGDFSDETIRRLVPLFEETEFTADLIEESRANLEEALRERGYRDARVSVQREPLATRRHLVLRFVAEPGIRYRVAEIRIEGLQSLRGAEVRALFVTRTRSRARSAPFRQDVWEDDLKEIRGYLARHGFHRARVEWRERITDPDTRGLLTLVVIVEEGPRAFVGSVEVEGAGELAASTVLAAGGIEPGDPFDGAEVVEARERIVTLYRDQGFRDAHVEASTMLNDAGTLAAVTLSVHEGSRTLVDRVILSGLEVTRESAVRPLLAVRSGEPLSSSGVLETRQRLVGSGLFRSVDVEVLPADPLTRRSDVLISVEEGPRTTFGYGFGYEERQLARAEIEVTRRNLFGLNRTVSIFTRGSFRGGRFITTYRQPDTFGVRLPLFVSAFAEEEERTSFDFNRVGVALQVSKRLGDRQNLLFGYRFDRTKVFDLEVDIEDIDRRFRNVLISALSVASVSDTRDDPLDPASGGFRIVDFEWSSGLLGSREPYVKGLVQQFYYFSLPHDMVAALGLRLGIGQTTREDRDVLLPPVERFYAGGANTLRGFALDEASPKRQVEVDGQVVDGPPLGGNVLALANLELRFPILGNLRGVVFSDNGNVYRRLSVIELLNWRYNMGFGFRFDTPLGPLRVDYGFKLDRRLAHSIECPNRGVPCKESFGQWHVSLGHAF